MEAASKSMAVSLNQMARNLPILRGLVHEVSPYHTGSVFENRLGLQVFRVLGKHIAWRLRSRTADADIRQYIDVLDRDGVLVLHDFLPEEDFKAVREEYDSIRSSMSFKSFREVDYGAMQVANFDLKNEDGDHSMVRKCLQENPLIIKLAAAVIKRQINLKPSVRLSAYRKVSDDAPDNDVENILHADLHTPTVKAFYYLNDIDESNGAFVYVKGSHRLSLNRVKHEYSISVRTARLKRGDTIPADLMTVRGPNKRAVIAKEHLGDLTETSICGKANTLVIADNMGFHRRGVFTSDKVRETIIVNFRLFERCFW